MSTPPPQPLLGRNARLVKDSVAIGYCKNISVKATQEMIKDYSMDSNDPAVSGPGKRTFTWSAERLFTDKTYLQLLKETGMKCGEASQLKWTDVDLVDRSVRITPEKGSNPRILPLSLKLVNMLEGLSKENETIFKVTADLMRRNYDKQRKQIAFKLKNSRLNQITFHTFRHWKATMEYYKTRDILHVKEILGHKSLLNTMLYTQLIGFKDDDFSARVAHSEEEACQLIESGFEYICDFGQNKIFRKRK